MVGNLNTRIIVQTLVNTTDAGGGVTRTVDSLFTLWAKVENRTGQAIFSEGQRQVGYDYRITVRAFPSAPITTANKIQYGLKKLNIDSVQILNEGRIDFYILKCSLHGGN